MPELMRNMPPFYVALLVVLGLLLAFPQLVMWLPSASG
jgi:TRAP-type C4-dicarboxylate transport system permease large subunit